MAHQITIDRPTRNSQTRQDAPFNPAWQGQAPAQEPARYTPGPVIVEHNVPLPEFNRAQKYPWRDMQVGDSFLVVGKRKASFAPYAREKGKSLGFDFRCRDEESGVRVWRTA